MKTARISNALPRNGAAALALALTLAGAVGVADLALAQAGPVCSRFDSSLDGWGPCSTHPNVNVITSTAGGLTATNPYLRIIDHSGASAVCSNDVKYRGDWVERMGGCGEFCFDFKVFHAGYPPALVTPQFSIYDGSGNRAVFAANFTMTATDPWRQTICAPIRLIQPGESLPSSASGAWTISGSSSYNALWNAIITNVANVMLPIDFTAQPSEIVGYDNLCMNPAACPPPPPPPPPEITGCLKDMTAEVKCNPNGSYTVTLSGSSFKGSSVTLTSTTSGGTVTPPQQPWSATMTWTITGAAPGQKITLNADATQNGGGKEPGADLCCAGEIVIVLPNCPKPLDGALVVEKKVINNTRASAAAINALTFPIGLSCSPPSGLNVSFGLNNGGSHTQSNMPYTSVCTVTEAVKALPPPPRNACGEGATAVWATPVISPASVAISAPASTVTVLNQLDCKKVEKLGTLRVEKRVQNNGPIPLPSSLQFPFTLTCGAPFSLTGGGLPHIVSNLPVGSSCTVTEGAPPIPPGVCPQGSTPTWSVNSSPQTVTIPASVVVTNTFSCRKASDCPPGTILEGQQCVKVTGPPIAPPPVVPPSCRRPMVANAAGACVCPPRTVQRGGRCVPEVVCRAPMTPNAAGACVCPQNTVRRGQTCVRVPVCNPPAKLNRRGVCECPPGMAARGNACVLLERRPVAPNDWDRPRRPRNECPPGMAARGNSCGVLERRTSAPSERDRPRRPRDEPGGPLRGGQGPDRR